MDLESEEVPPEIKLAEKELQKEMFEINSGRIFSVLQNHWKDFPRKLILELEVQAPGHFDHIAPIYKINVRRNNLTILKYCPRIF